MNVKHLSRLVITTLVAAPAVLVFAPAKAQVIEGNIYYYTSTNTIDTSIPGKDVVIGKNPGGAVANASGDTNISSPYTVFLATGANVTSNGNNDGYEGLSTWNSTVALINGGAVEQAEAYNASQIIQKGGHIALVRSHHATTVSGELGTVGFAASFDTSAIHLFQGAFGINAYNNSTIFIRGGNSNSAWVWDSGTINMGTGFLQQIQAMEANSKAFLNGGTVGTASGFLGTITIGGANVTEAQAFGGNVIMNGGNVVEASVDNKGVFTMRGGTVNAFMGIQGTLNMSGGFVGNARFGKGFKANITGGVIQKNTLYQEDDTAIVHFFGHDIEYSNAQLGQNPFTNAPGVYYDVRWTRPDDVVVETRYFDMGGTLGDPGPQGVLFSFAGAPEPTAIHLLLPGIAAGAFLLRTRIRRIGRG